MTIEWTAARRATLRAFCDCTFPRLRESADPHGFWQRKASDFGVDLATEQVIEHGVGEAARAGLIGLIDAFAANGLAQADAEVGEQIVRAIAASSPAAAGGVVALQQLVLSLCYALPDAEGKNPNWPALGYPGPQRAPRPREKPIRPLAPERDEQTLEADVCVIGSGAGGGVIAGELAQRGLSVVVLEAGGYYDEGDFNQLELWAFQNLYWRGGITPTADGTVALIAGASLGGGTTVNWLNCVRPPPSVRDEWSREHGLDDVAGPSFDRIIDGVLERLQATDQCSELNPAHQRLEAGARALGYGFKRCVRNVDAAKHDPDVAGYQGFGDVTGSRVSTVDAYLADAHRLGTRILVRTRAERILITQGRATGVTATSISPDGSRRSVIVRAPRVVVAGGALETPALLKRSGIDSPAVGDYLRVHPVVALTGVYPEDLRNWWGPPQAGLVDALLQIDEGYGLMFECAHHSHVVAASGVPWQSGRQHKALMADSARYAGFIAIARDRGHGRVDIDAAGEAVPQYPLRDPRDIAMLQRGLRELAALHRAAGAEQIMGFCDQTVQTWRPGADFDEFTRRIAGGPGGLPRQTLFSAHQMGTARLGKDPKTSVAQPTGELHGVRGIWIGDTSAFPTAIGVNPMVTCMALATRTAGMIADQR